MKIVFLSRYQNTVNRGAETFVAELGKRLSKKFQVKVFSGNDADNIQKILKGNFDIVISMNGRGQSLMASLGRLQKKYKLVITGQSGIGRDDIWNIAICRPDVFVTLTDYMADWAEKWAWGTKVAKIPNGVDIEKFKPGKTKIKTNLKRPIVLSVGALTWYKHHEYTIEALSFLPEVSLLIVGKGEEKEKLEKMAKEKLGQRFSITPFSYKEIPRVYQMADLFVLPSWPREAFGIVYLEAMASGLAVVAPDDAPRREIVGQAGILTNVTDPQKYAAAIDLALKTKWGNKPIEQAKKFSWNKVADLYGKVFESL